MSDADNIMEKWGLGFVDDSSSFRSDDEYDELDRKKWRFSFDKSARFQYRGKKRIQCSSEETLEVAIELLKVKREIQALKIRERELKNSIQNALSWNEYLEVPMNEDMPLMGCASESQVAANKIAIIESCRKSSTAVLNRKRVFGYIQRKYGRLAAREMLEQCLSKARKTSETVYVRIFDIPK